MIRAYNFGDPVAAHDAMCEQLVYGDQRGGRMGPLHGTEVAPQCGIRLTAPLISTTT